MTSSRRCSGTEPLLRGVQNSQRTDGFVVMHLEIIVKSLKFDFQETSSQIIAFSSILILSKKEVKMHFIYFYSTDAIQCSQCGAMVLNEGTVTAPGEGCEGHFLKHEAKLDTTATNVAEAEGDTTARNVGIKD